MRALSPSRQRWLLAFIGLALAMRMLVPAGWMPTFGDGRATITLCTGAGMVEAWVDEDGRIHKESPQDRPATDQPCAFAGFGVAGDIRLGIALAAPLPPVATVPPVLVPVTVTIGHGLAAPPPPAIGPPALI